MIGITYTTVNGRFENELLLSSLLSTFRRDGLKPEDVRVYIIGDKNTPDLSFWDFDYCMEYYDAERQEAELPKELNGFLGWRTDDRRNAGFYLALRDGCEWIIALDDDNIPIPDRSFVKRHIEKPDDTVAVSSSNGWVNICDALAFAPDRVSRVYSRGTPLSKRFNSWYSMERYEPKRVVCNVGLWFFTPDADGAAHAMAPTFSVGLRGQRSKWLAAPGSFLSINTQNTAFHRSLGPAIFSPKMPPGSPIRRFNDIWMGLVIKRLADAMGDGVSFGEPLSLHLKRPDPLRCAKEMRDEALGFPITDSIISALKRVELEGEDYADDYAKCAESLLSMTDELAIPGLERFLRDVFWGMLKWLEMVEEIS